MFVRDHMTRHPIMIEPDKDVVAAQKLMVENKLRHIPVVGPGKKLVGMITRERLAIEPSRLGSLDVWEITRLLSDLKVKNLMAKADDLKFIHEDATLEEAAVTIGVNKLGGLPVVDSDHAVVGILTETDLMVALARLLGAEESGVRLTVRVPSKVGMFDKINHEMSRRGWTVMASGGLRAAKYPDKWDLIFKIVGVSEAQARELVAAFDEFELVDVRETVDISALQAL